MGFFSFLKPVAKVFTKTVAPAIATGGLSLIPGVKKVVAPISNIATKVATLQTDPKQLVRTALAVGTGNPLAALPVAPANSGGPMALDIGGILRSAGSIFGGNQNQVFSGISNVAQLASQFFPTGATAIAVRPPAPVAPAMRAAAGAMVTRGFFNRFPNLANSIAQLRARGMNVKRSQLWSLLKRFGPEILVTGGLLTAAAVNELMVAGPGRRRMNPANVKALRRSIRRLDSFHRLCVSADKLRRPRSRGGKCKTGSGGTFVRQG